jgi:hypothetical protein
VVGLDHDDGATRAQTIVEGVGDLGRETFLELRPSRVPLHEPRQLAETDDPSVRSVSQMSLANKWQEMMFAKARQRYIAD